MMALLPVTGVSLPVTIIYTFLLAWGFWVGVHQIYQGFRKPQELLNPLFKNRMAITMFTVHIFVVSIVLFVSGPLALHYKSRLWYWGGAIAILTASLPIAAYFNRNTQSFGKLIGTWVRFRNLFEVSLHVAVAAAAINFFHYYVLLWWIVAYRYLDVGPRRLFQTLYNTPEKRERRPWAPTLNWAVIATLYVLAFLAVYNRKVIYAVPPSTSRPLHVSHTWEIALVGAINIAIALAFWVMIRIYTGVGPAAAELAKDATPTAPDEPQVVAT
jgi:hypothetical protein